MRTTPHDLRALLFLASFQDEHGYSASIRDLAKATGTTVHRAEERFHRLRDHGYMIRAEHRSRATSVTELGRNAVLQAAGKATAGFIALPIACRRCGSLHFYGFLKPCGKCLPRWRPSRLWHLVEFASIPQRLRHLAAGDAWHRDSRYVVASADLKGWFILEAQGVYNSTPKRYPSLRSAITAVDSLMHNLHLAGWMDGWEKCS